jgi:acyl phosphate:glycerol-3-phosphate acyltransferase
MAHFLHACGIHFARKCFRTTWRNNHWRKGDGRKRVEGAFEAPATWVELIAAFIVGYALGSVPFGIVLTRLAGGPDLRSIGSGSIGATNVLRTGRKGLAAATLLGDLLKGTLAVLIAKWLLTTPSAGWWQTPPPALAAACGAFFGHLFPVWLGFKGGKGVATFLGCLLGLFWPAALIFALIWLTIAYLTRYSSLAALWASVAGSLVLIGFGLLRAGLVFGLLAALLWARHAGNIKRLLAGRESRIGSKS